MLKFAKFTRKKYTKKRILSEFHNTVAFGSEELWTTVRRNQMNNLKKPGPIFKLEKNVEASNVADGQTDTISP